jgi:DNA helicase-2/ATP-dependent DNA helicase PcrA
MSNHKLIVSSAGSGKTTFLVREAIKNSDKNVLITTYTEANEKEIRRKFIDEIGYVPRNITIKTWFSFLIQHCIKPFQGLMNDKLFENDIKGMILVSKQSAVRFISKSGFPVIFKEEDNFDKHYFTKGNRIYSDKISKFISNLSKKDSGNTFSRISRVFDHIMIDEVQDLAGNDLEIIKLLMKNCSEVTMVGDPRQVTYLTHIEAKHRGYRKGKIKEFLIEKCKSLIKNGIDEATLSDSHRCPSSICDYASKLYIDFTPMTSCGCCNIVPNIHEGVFLVRPDQVLNYLNVFMPMQLRWDKRADTHLDFESLNFGESKGATFERVLIYPTGGMENWIIDNANKLTDGARAKFYVGLTRARYSVAIVFDYDNSVKYPGLIKYKVDE